MRGGIILRRTMIHPHPPWRKKKIRRMRRMPIMKNYPKHPNNNPRPLLLPKKCPAPPPLPPPRGNELTDCYRLIKNNTVMRHLRTVSSFEDTIWDFGFDDNATIANKPNYHPIKLLACRPCPDSFGMPRPEEDVDGPYQPPKRKNQRQYPQNKKTKTIMPERIRPRMTTTRKTREARNVLPTTIPSHRPAMAAKSSPHAHIVKNRLAFRLPKDPGWKNQNKPMTTTRQGPPHNPVGPVPPVPFVILRHPNTLAWNCKRGCPRRPLVCPPFLKK
mmetsp:Transcript_15259/g.31479  ORF Transcript_15259/g.31479 Transcript_15259/m.31479 type:complete len:273 (-) Transcript_15259:464-1282(-)